MSCFVRNTTDEIIFEFQPTEVKLKGVTRILKCIQNNVEIERLNYAITAVRAKKS